jgi:hypothetical protein
VRCFVLTVTIAKISEETIIKEAEAALVMKHRTIDPSIHRERRHIKQIQTGDGTLPFFRFQHNHLECVIRSAILKLKTPMVIVA